MGSVSRRLKRDMAEVMEGTRANVKKGYAIQSDRIDRRVARAEARLKARRNR